RIGQVPFIVLKDVGDVRQTQFEGLEVLLEVGKAFDVFGHFLVLGVGDKDDAIDAPQDELASRVVDDLAGDRIELEFGFEAFDGHRFDGQEVEKQGAVGTGGQGDEFALVTGGGLDVIVDLDQVSSLSAHGGAIIDDFDLKFF